MPSFLGVGARELVRKVRVCDKREFEGKWKHDSYFECSWSLPMSIYFLEQGNQDMHGLKEGGCNNNYK